MTDGEIFLNALAGDEAHMPADERLILCGFDGDPNNAPQHAWRPRPWRPGKEIVLNDQGNGYVTVASFRRAGDQSFRRRSDCFAAGLALMIDDVNTKIPMSVMNDAPPPSAIVETSLNNFQWWYFFSEPERDGPRYDAIIRSFIDNKLLGSDPGMAGITRVGRIPGFLNCKPSAKNWRVQLRSLTDHRYTTGQLLEAFKLSIVGRRDITRRPKLATEEAVERNRNFTITYKWLEKHGMIKKDEPDISGWHEATCPWIDTHTAGADTGSAIREPAEENEYYGAWRCHHGHCHDKGFAELQEWIANQAEEELNAANANAPDLVFEEVKAA